jgi:hypothetical protein
VKNRLHPAMDWVMENSKNVKGAETTAANSNFDFSLRQFHAVPAALSNALGNCPRNNLSVSIREVVERFPRACNLASTVQVAV